jgi:signal transduction histidine kinase
MRPIGRLDKTSLKLRVTDTDTGIGIAADVLPTLFDPFIQIEGYLELLLNSYKKTIGLYL